MEQTHMSFHPMEMRHFGSGTHLFPTNELVMLHNRRILKNLNSPIVGCVVECMKCSEISTANDEHLEVEVLLCLGHHVMLKCKLWVEVCLVNYALGYVTNILYMAGSKPPQIPLYVTVLLMGILVFHGTNVVQNL